MYLIYADETGSSFNRDADGNFRDGPFFIYGGLSIDINKYEEIEGSFKNLCKNFLGVDNIFKTEIHAGDIFYKKGYFNGISDDNIFLFFDEVLQLMAKFAVRTHIGITYKDANIFKNEHEYVVASIHCFFYLMDSFLSKEGRRGLIIADEIEETNLKKQTKSDYFHYLSDDNNLIGKNGGANLSVILRRIFYERINRFTEISITPVLQLKYRYESKLYFILDNIHYVDSKLSINTQLADITLFIVSVILEVCYANILDKKTSSNKKNLVAQMERTISHYFYNCVSTAHMIRMGGSYDVMYNPIYGNPAIAENPFGIIKGMIDTLIRQQNS